MNNLYRITNRNGVTLCFQFGNDEKSACESARMYGHRGVRNAEFVRVND